MFRYTINDPFATFWSVFKLDSFDLFVSSLQKCCSLSTTRWGISQIYSRTRWTRQALYRVVASHPPHSFKHKLLRHPSPQPLFSIRAPTLASSLRRCPRCRCPSPLPSHPRRRPPPPPFLQCSNRWPAALHSFNHGLRWSNPSRLNSNRQPSQLFRYLLSDTAGFVFLTDIFRWIFIVCFYFQSHNLY